MTKEIYKKAISCVPADVVPELCFNNVHRCDPANDGSFVFFDEESEMFTIIRPNKLNSVNGNNTPWQVRFTSLEVLEHLNYPLNTAQLVESLDKIPGVLFGGMSLEEAKKAIKTHSVNKAKAPHPTVKTGNEKKVTKVSYGPHVEQVKDPYKNINNGIYKPPITE